MILLELKQLGTSAGLEIPQDMLAHLKARKGDTLVAIKTPNGYLLASRQASVENQFKASKELMEEYRETLNKLAK